jgi:hypothetical protein
MTQQNRDGERMAAGGGCWSLVLPRSVLASRMYAFILSDLATQKHQHRSTWAIETIITDATIVSDKEETKTVSDTQPSPPPTRLFAKKHIAEASRTRFRMRAKTTPGSLE